MYRRMLKREDKEIKYTDKELKVAAAGVTRMIYALPDEVGDVDFCPSWEYRAKMASLLAAARAVRRQRSLWKKAIAVAAAFVICFCTVLAVNVDDRNGFFGLFNISYEANENESGYKIYGYNAGSVIWYAPKSHKPSRLFVVDPRFAHEYFRDKAARGYACWGSEDRKTIIIEFDQGGGPIYL